MGWYLKVLRQYADFSGRARRLECWLFALFNVVILTVLVIIDTVARLSIGSNTGLLGSIYLLAVLVPGLAVGARRLHDVGYSGWWQVLDLVPIAGWAVVIRLFCMEGDPEDNRWGPNPMAVPATGKARATA
jgi:uncharacterized membrane protein YhaH (DUF805 family)